jgi:cullin-4
MCRKAITDDYFSLECGPGFTSKLEGMFKDTDISRDLMATFKVCFFVQQKYSGCSVLSRLHTLHYLQNHKSYDDIKNLQLYVNVLTQGFWPTYPPVEITLPPDVRTPVVTLSTSLAVFMS